MISVWCFTVISVLQTDAWMKDFVLAVTHLRQRMGLCLRRNMDPGNMSRNSEDPFWHGIISANNNFCWMSYFLQSFCANRKGQWSFQLIATCLWAASATGLVKHEHLRGRDEHNHIGPHPVSLDGANAAAGSLSRWAHCENAETAPVGPTGSGSARCRGASAQCRVDWGRAFSGKCSSAAIVFSGSGQIIY